MLRAQPGSRSRRSQLSQVPQVAPAVLPPDPPPAPAPEPRLAFDEPQQVSLRADDAPPAPIELDEVASEFEAASEPTALHGDDDDFFEYEDEPIRQRG